MARSSGAGFVQPERVIRIRIRMRRQASVLLCAVLAAAAGPLSVAAQDEATWEMQTVEVPAGGCGKVSLGSSSDARASYSVLPLPRPVRPCLPFKLEITSCIVFASHFLGHPRQKLLCSGACAPSLAGDAPRPAVSPMGTEGRLGTPRVLLQRFIHLLLLSPPHFPSSCAPRPASVASVLHRLGRRRGAKAGAKSEAQNSPNNNKYEHFI